MFLVLSASKDTYITDKIIANSYRVEDANVGRAGTLDLFKLYEESSWISGSERVTGSVVELSRALIKFELGRIGELTSSILDLNHSSFKCTLKLSDILGGQTNPSNFNLALFPLAQGFDEGIGRDVISFNDIGTANFMTASYVGGNENIWFMSGADEQGILGQASIDVIASGNIGDGSGVDNLTISQHFPVGNEDLSMDVTKIVSATVVGLLPDHGFRLSYSGSEETDTKTRFVKRFASRHVRNRKLRPRLEVSWDDTIQDNHESFFFDLTGSLFLQNYHRGQGQSILSGASLTPLAGQNCMIVSLETGSFTTSSFVHQYTGSTDATKDSTYPGIPGLYYTTFCIDSVDTSSMENESTLENFIIDSGSITFKTYWKTKDELQAFHTGSLTINKINRVAFNPTKQSLELIVTNAKSVYHKNERVKFRVFVQDTAQQLKVHKVPIALKSVVLDEVYYRIRDAVSNEIVVPFARNNNGTRMSTDSDGLFFEMFMEYLTIGRSYMFDFLVVDRGIESVVSSENVRFKVEP